MKTCAHCSGQFETTGPGRAFYQKLQVPEPTHCPECRQQRRYSFRNDQNYYHNTCHICRKDMISIYSPDKKIPVLCDECFWNDRFDPLAYGQDFDFNRSFFEQYGEMRAKMPRLAIYHTQSENAEYTVHSSKNRNCYLASSLVECEDVHYSDFIFNARDCMDIFSCLNGMEFCYECSYSEDCYNCDYVEICSTLSDSYLCFDCKGSQDLVGCVAIRNQKNMILNKQKTKEECHETIRNLKADPKFREEFFEKFKQLKLSKPKRDAWIINTENCIGNHLRNCKNVYYGYNSWNIEDGRYTYECQNNTDCSDVTRVGKGEMLHECSGIVELQFSMFCNLTYQSANCLYCDNSQGITDCFGCMSMKKNSYCVLNKKYGKEEYEELLKKIKAHMLQTGEWGEFFPISLSPFGYNETKASEWYPLSKKEVLTEGWNWSEYQEPFPQVSKTIPADRLPNSITDVPDDILNWAIICEMSKKPFKIIQAELEFYRKKGLPIPHRSPQQRHKDRVSRQSPRKMYGRQCAKCGKTIETTYPPEGSEKVYCERCYLEMVY